jgi:16S rRNA (guanine966-N2)-methyltransferase
MRVITGRFKGRQLITVPDRSIRPATDRVKQTLFDILSTRLDLEDAVVLDLYAGTGSLGIEALSRGARHCTFVDSSGDAVACIERNLKALGCETIAEVVQADAQRFILSCRESFRLIFADPPYAYALTSSLPNAVFGHGLLEPSGYLLIEHSKNIIFDESTTFSAAAVKKFGSTHVSFFIHSASRG